MVVQSSHDVHVFEYGGLVPHDLGTGHRLWCDTGALGVRLGAVRTNWQGLWGAEARSWSKPKEGRTNLKTWDLALGTDHDIIPNSSCPHIPDFTDS